MAALVAAASSAHADVVVEEYVGERPADADVVLKPLRTELAMTLHEAVRPDLVAQLLANVAPFPGVADQTLDAATLREQLDQGFRKFNQGDFAEAGKALEDGLERVYANPALFVTYDQAPALLTQSYAAWGVSLRRRGDDNGGKQPFAEQFRSFPDVPIPHATFGPEGDKLAAMAREQVITSGQSHLLIEVTRSDAQIYIRENGRGRGGSFSGTVASGLCRILVMSGGIGRRYTRELRPNQPLRLSIDWDADSAFTINPRWVGFLVPETQRDRLLSYEVRLVRAINLDALIVLGIVNEGGRRFITGRTLAARVGDVVHGGKIPVEGASPDDIRSFAKYLVLGTPAPVVLPWSEPPHAASPIATSTSDGWHLRTELVPTYAASAGSIAAFAVGAYLLHLDGKGTCPAGTADDCPQVYKTTLPGIATLGLGAAMTAFAIYWYVRDPGPRRRAHDAEALVGWRF